MTPPRKPTTLKDVARRAGVHFTTVSLALRGHPRIPAATRARLTALAAELGYRRDPVLMALTERRLRARMSGRRPLIALLSNHPSVESFNGTEHMRLFLAGAREQAEACGYECELILAGAPHPNGAELVRELERRGCVGAVLAALHTDYVAVKADLSRFALSRIDARSLTPNVPFVSNDQMQVVRLAFRKMRELGYRRIGLEVGDVDESGTQRMFSSGWMIEQAAIPSAERVPMLSHSLSETNAAFSRRLGEWVSDHRIDAVLGNSEFTLELLKDAGLRVPRDVAFACLCRTAAGRRVAGVMQDHRRVGAKAVELVALGVRTGRREADVVCSDTYVPGHWIDGATAPSRL